MGDAYGKVIAILLASVLMFLIPVLYISERQETAAQSYVLTETAYLVDSVRNTGVLTEGMYREYEKRLCALEHLYEIQLMHAAYPIYENGGRFETKQERHYSEEIKETLRETGCYYFLMDEFFRIEVKDRRGSMGERLLNGFLKEDIASEKIIAFYGGTIKYEAY